METQLNLLLEAGIIVPSTSQYASPVLLVKKSDGGYRLAVDFRKINKKLIKDAFPIPNIAETIDSFSGAKYFSSLDLTSGFFQQCIAKDQQHITAIATHKGQFNFTRTPFGMCNSSNSFQRLMQYILGDLRDLGILVYIDDIALASKDIETHFERLNLIFQRLREHNLRLKPSKCHFFQSEIDFLGFKVKNGQVQPLDKNVAVIEKFKVPESRKQLRSFLGCLNFYRKFIPDFSQRALTLTNLTKEKNKFKWSDQAQAEFEDLKGALSKIPQLHLPDMAKPFIVHTDASAYALGAVLAQEDENGFPAPIAFASRKLKEVETRYHTTEREFLAVCWAINYFKCYLYNTEFTIYTDHAALTHALKLQNPPSRIGRWMTSIADYNFKVKYIKGRCNSAADFLSRYVEYNEKGEEHVHNLNEASNVDNVNNNNLCILNNETLLQEIKVAQDNDKFCQALIKKLSKDQVCHPTALRFFVQDEILMCEKKVVKHRREGGSRIVLPKTMINKIFELTHNSASACHAGFFKTFERVKSTYFWPGMYINIKQLVATCLECLKFRAHKSKGLAELQRLPIPDAPGHTLHVDISGPYPQTYSGNKYIISFIDKFSKWIEAIAISNVTSDTVAEALAEVICRQGCPKVLVTDKAKNFLSEAIEKVYKMLGIKHIPTTAYHPSSNGQIERAHASMNSALAQIVDTNHRDWDSKLKFALLALRSAVHTATQDTPFFITTGRDINLPYNIIEKEHPLNYNDNPSYCEDLIVNLSNVYKQVKDHLEKSATKQEEYRKKSAVDKKIKIGKLVMLYTPFVKPGLCKKFYKKNTGPYRVLEKRSPVNFKIQLITNPKNIQVVHVDRLFEVGETPEFIEDSMLQEENEHTGVHIEGEGTQDVNEVNNEDLIAQYANRPISLAKKLLITGSNIRNFENQNNVITQHKTSDSNISLDVGTTHTPSVQIALNQETDSIEHSSTGVQAPDPIQNVQTKRAVSSKKTYKREPYNLRQRK